MMAFVFLMAVGGHAVAVADPVVPLVVAATIVVIFVVIGVGVTVKVGVAVPEVVADDAARKSFLSKSSCWRVYCA